MVRRPFQVGGKDSIIYAGELSKVYAIQNAAFEKVYGFHAGIKLNMGEGFSVMSKYNYQNGNEEMENGTVSSARHAAPAFGETTFQFKREGLDMLFSVAYNAKVDYKDLNPEEQGKPTIYAKDREEIRILPVGTL